MIYVGQQQNLDAISLFDTIHTKAVSQHKKATKNFASAVDKPCALVYNNIYNKHNICSRRITG